MTSFLKKIGLLSLLITLFLNTALYAEELGNTLIEMDELVVEGKIEKPLEIYIIPRADLQLEMELNDSIIKEFKLTEITMDAPSKMLPDIYKNQVGDKVKLKKQAHERANCVSCHYQADFSKLSDPGVIAVNINNVCITCHRTEYYTASWDEIKETLALYIEKTLYHDSNNKGILYRQDGKISFENDFLCNKCHTLNDTMFRETYPTEFTDKTYSVDIICNICHINYISEEE